jgi:L-iditol 2-dehydrogenase
MRVAMLYGSEDLRIERVPMPRLQPGEVLVRVKTALTCGTDLKTYHRGSHVMINRLPSPFGHEFSGVVEEVSEEVEWIRPGTPVVAANSAPCLRCEFCKSGRHNLCDNLEFLNGAYAEFIAIPASIVRCNLHPIPMGMDPVQAALTEPLACVLHGLERSNIQMGQSVCVLGVGPIGLMFVVLAARKGARVIAVGRSNNKLERALRLGAHEAISLDERRDPKRLILEKTPFSKGADVVIEAVGHPATWELALEVVKKGGVVNLFGGCARGTKAHIDAHSLHYGDKTIISVFHHTPHFVSMALRLLETRVIRAEDFVTHTLRLENLESAFRYMESGQALKVAISIEE